MKVGDWVLVTPDEFDLTIPRCMPPETKLAQVVTVERGRIVWVKFIFESMEQGPWQMYKEQCVVVAHSEVEDASQSDPT